MAAKFVSMCTLFALCSAVPLWINEKDYTPGVILRIGRTPNTYGFGRSYINQQSSSIRTQAAAINLDYPFDDINGIQRVQGGAQVGLRNIPYPISNRYSNTAAFSAPSGSSAAASAKTIGSHYGPALSSARTNGYQSGSATSSAKTSGQNNRAAASAKIVSGSGYLQRTNDYRPETMGYASASSLAQTNGFNNYGSAVAAARNGGLVPVSVQRHEASAVRTQAHASAVNRF